MEEERKKKEDKGTESGPECAQYTLETRKVRRSFSRVYSNELLETIPFFFFLFGENSKNLKFKRSILISLTLNATRRENYKRYFFEVKL